MVRRKECEVMREIRKALHGSGINLGDLVGERQALRGAGAKRHRKARCKRPLL